MLFDTPSNVTIGIWKIAPGLTDTCTPNGGTCASKCITGSSRLLYSCTGADMCCSPNLCIVANRFIARYTQSFTQQQFINFVAIYYPGIDQSNLVNYIINYDSLCRPTRVFSIYSMYEDYLIPIGKIFSATNPSRALIIMGFILVLIILLLIIRREEKKKKGIYKKKDKKKKFKFKFKTKKEKQKFWEKKRKQKEKEEKKIKRRKFSLPFYPARFS